MTRSSMHAGNHATIRVSRRLAVWRRVALAIGLGALLAGCSLQKMAVNSIGDAIASGGSVFERDDDIVLVGEALPFSLKLLESLLSESPRHQGLLLAIARGYLLYAYAYVGEEAETLAGTDLARAAVARARAHRLYLRAHDHALRGLEAGYPGLRAEIAADGGRAVIRVGGSGSQDVALLHAAAASLALAIASNKQDAAMLARLPEVDALLTRALELDADWNVGALHELAVTWLASRPGARPTAAIEHHYARALALSGGRRAGVYVGYAEAVKVPAQARSEFVQLMNQALAVEPDADPNNRLLNALAQRRARWLLGQLDQLFLE